MKFITNLLKITLLIVFTQLSLINSIYAIKTKDQKTQKKRVRLKNLNEDVTKQTTNDRAARAREFISKFSKHVNKTEIDPDSIKIHEVSNADGTTKYTTVVRTKNKENIKQKGVIKNKAISSAEFDLINIASFGLNTKNSGITLGLNSTLNNIDCGISYSVLKTKIKPLTYSASKISFYSNSNITDDLFINVRIEKGGVKQIIVVQK
jgi:hypothetical protein